MPHDSGRMRRASLVLSIGLLLAFAALSHGQPPPALPPDVTTPAPQPESDRGRVRLDAEKLTATPDPTPARPARPVPNGIIRDDGTTPAKPARLDTGWVTTDGKTTPAKPNLPLTQPSPDLTSTRPAPGTPARAGTGHALLVAVREYEHDALADLQYTENDIEKLATLLGQPGSPFRGNVRVLTTTRGQRNPADRPTAANLRRELERLTRDRTRGETVLLALSGHGVQLLVPDPAELGPDRSYAYFCPADAQLQGASYASGRHPRLINLKDALAQLGDCGAGARLVLVDACRNELKLRTRSLQVKREMVPEGVAALFSCKGGEFAHESSRLEHGLFFHFVLEGLRGKASNRRGEVTWGGLAEYVTERVAEDAEAVLGEKVKQTPQEIKNISGKSPLLLTVGRSETIEVGPEAPGVRPSGETPNMLGD